MNIPRTDRAGYIYVNSRIFVNELCKLGEQFWQIIAR